MDHYFDQEPMQAYALKTGNSEMTAVFKQAKVLLLSNAVLLALALALSPPWTWAMVAIFFGPAFVWDFKLFVFGGKREPKKKVEKGPASSGEKHAFTIKRIPGMKAVLIGIIRGYVRGIHTYQLPPDKELVQMRDVRHRQLYLGPLVHEWCDASEHLEPYSDYRLVDDQPRRPRSQ